MQARFLRWYLRRIPAPDTYAPRYMSFRQGYTYPTGRSLTFLIGELPTEEMYSQSLSIRRIKIRPLLLSLLFSSTPPRSLFFLLFFFFSSLLLDESKKLFLDDRPLPKDDQF